MKAAPKSQIVVGDPDRPPAALGAPGSSAGLASALVEFEARVSARPPGEVLLADASDEALAALLVASKMLLPVFATESARDPSTANGRLIAQLAEAYTRPA